MPTITFQGELTWADSKRYIFHEFDVPAGTAALRLIFKFSPRRIEPFDNLLTLMLLDPSGAWRGERHCCSASQSVTLAADSATPGYLAGPIPAGRWRVSLGVHAVLSTIESPLRYTLTIAAEPRPIISPALCNPLPRRIMHPGPAWYRGELHTHTLHSDGDYTVAQIISAARRRRFDFVALTDHNTVSQLREAGTLAPDDLLIIPGQELTTYHGHILALGVATWVDWRIGLNGYTVEQAVEAVRAAGGLFIIAHPFSEGDPGCTGCRWEYDLPPHKADALEIWNGPWKHNGNDEAIALWHRLLNEGHRLPATAGSDLHSLHEWLARMSCVEVYAASLDTQEILSAIRACRLTVTSGPHLTLEASADGGATWAMIGDEISSQGLLILRATWQDSPDAAELRLVRSGIVLDARTVGATGLYTYEDVQPTGWYTAELRAPDESLLAATNPIFVRP